MSRLHSALLLSLGLTLTLAPVRARAQEEEDTDVSEEEVLQTIEEELAPDLAPAPKPDSRSTATRTAPAPTPAARTVPAAAKAPAADDDRPAAPEPSAAANPANPAVAVTPAPASEPPVDPRRAPPRPILLPRASDADLQATWTRWRTATANLDSKDAEAAERELVRLKEELGIENLESLAVGFARASGQRRAAQDPAGALRLADVAVQLAPEFPLARVAMANARFAQSDWGGAISEVNHAVVSQLRDPRYLRPAVADVASAALFALTATAGAVVLVLFLRRGKYFLHDFHHLFPRSAARWQTGAIAILLLALPLVLRSGLLPVLLVLGAAVALYLSPVERVVVGALIAVISLLPLAAELLVEQSTFAGTLAEDVLELEHGGLAAAPAARRVRARVEAGEASFEELFAVGRYELRRGELDAAIAHFKKAAGLRTNEPRLLTNLGNALLARGDPEGAAEIYKTAAQADPTLAAPLYNVSRLYNRRATMVSDEFVGGELEKANHALAAAQALDASLLFRKDPPDDQLIHNRLLLSPGLTAAEIASLARDDGRAEKVAAQFAQAISGTSSTPLAYLYPVLAALALVGFGTLAQRLSASRACDKCGRAVCRRCDPELGIGSPLCAQCVNAFARRAAVPAATKVRKQIEVERYRRRRDRISYALGMVCSGAGHLFSGLPVRGAAYAFLFLFVVFNAVFRLGVLRAPYGALPEALKLVPLALLLAGVYLLSLRGLYKRQTE